MQRHNQNGLAVAQFLAAHPRIERVLYPGLESHPYHDIARRSMRGFGGLITFMVRDADWRKTANVVDAVRIPRIAPSLGGVESLIERRARYAGDAAIVGPTLCRLSVGIENIEDLWADLDNALRGALG